VERNDKTVKSFPVSLGKSEGGYRTRSGIKILTGEKYSMLRMVGTDRLSGERWDVMSPYSIRLTPTGEFIHGAPWAYHRLGRANGSHGCTNMYVGDAKWLFNRVIPGDPTVTRGTGRPMEVTNGTPGSYWNYSWKAWKAKSRR
jgi:lipoprotein-anchoring transpeptidase ErfK/SrfK